MFTSILRVKKILYARSKLLLFETETETKPVMKEIRQTNIYGSFILVLGDFLIYIPRVLSERGAQRSLGTSELDLPLQH